jgi:hypothetical protein
VSNVSKNGFPTSFTGLAAPVTHALDVDGRPQYGQTRPKVFWYANLIERFVMEIDDSLALDAFEVLMATHVGVETLGVA